MRTVYINNHHLINALWYVTMFLEIVKPLVVSLIEDIGMRKLIQVPVPYPRRCLQSAFLMV